MSSVSGMHGQGDKSVRRPGPTGEDVVGEIVIVYGGGGKGSSSPRPGADRPPSGSLPPMQRQRDEVRVEVRCGYCLQHRLFVYVWGTPEDGPRFVGQFSADPNQIVYRSTGEAEPADRLRYRFICHRRCKAGPGSGGHVVRGEKLGAAFRAAATRRRERERVVQVPHDVRSRVLT